MTNIARCGTRVPKGVLDRVYMPCFFPGVTNTTRCGTWIPKGVLLGYLFWRHPDIYSEVTHKTWCGARVAY